MSGASPGFRLDCIVVAMDFSEAAFRALDLAARLAREAGSAKLVLAHACFVPAEIELYALHETKLLQQQVSRASAEQLEKVLVDLQALGLASEFITRSGSPEGVICEVAREHAADLIVMGTHGRTGLAHTLLGSVAERTICIAPCPVMTLRTSDPG